MPKHMALRHHCLQILYLTNFLIENVFSYLLALCFKFAQTVPLSTRGTDKQHNRTIAFSLIISSLFSSFSPSNPTCHQCSQENVFIIVLN